MGRVAARRASFHRVARGETGTGVVETLVAALLASIALGAALALLRAHVHFARDLQSSLAALSSAAWTVDLAARDVALAGADAQRVGVEPLHGAAEQRVEVDSDVDGDGVVDAGSAERIALSWASGAGGRVLRRLGNQPMAIAGPVASDAFRVRYFDAAGAELAGELDADARARVRRVQVEIGVSERPGGERVRLSAAAALRMRVTPR
jgi:hypothetical protein